MVINKLIKIYIKDVRWEKMYDNYKYDIKIIEFIYSKNYEYVFLNLVIVK